MRNDPRGYKYHFLPNHPLAHKDGYVAEHRLVLYNAGIEIPHGYHVHHKNSDKGDNRIENLEVLSKEDHRKHHTARIVRNQYGTWETRKTYPHGHYIRYLKSGCRCKLCTQANADKAREYMERRRQTTSQ